LTAIRRTFDCAAGALREDHCQKTILERRLDVAVLDLAPERDVPLESAIEALAEGPVAIFAFGASLSTKHQDVPFKDHLDILLVHSGNLGGHPNLLVSFRDFNLGPGAWEPEPAAHRT
jgi:hypothetical protein